MHFYGSKTRLLKRCHANTTRPCAATETTAAFFPRPPPLFPPRPPLLLPPPLPPLPRPPPLPLLPPRPFPRPPPGALDSFGSAMAGTSVPGNAPSAAAPPQGDHVTRVSSSLAAASRNLASSGRNKASTASASSRRAFAAASHATDAISCHCRPQTATARGTVAASCQRCTPTRPTIARRA